MSEQSGIGNSKIERCKRTLNARICANCRVMLERTKIGLS